MFVIVDERESVTSGFVALFGRQGVAAAGLTAAAIDDFVGAASQQELAAVEAVLLGRGVVRREVVQLLRARIGAGVIAVVAEKSLEETLSLFATGVDDVVRQPVHVREIMARAAAIRRRAREPSDGDAEIVVFPDGRDPLIGGLPLDLPRRERRILEFLAENSGCRVSKTQIYNSVYGLFSDGIEESVIESHISKLRKRLRQRLGYDPIDSQRFLGYRLDAAPQRRGGSARARPGTCVQHDGCSG